MIAATRTLTTLVLCCAAAAASATDYQVEAALQVDAQAPASVKLSVSSGNTSVASLGPRQQLELSTVRSGGSEKLRIRLLDTSGARPVEMHVTETDSTYRRIGYGVCKGTVTFMSPASDIPFKCEG
jgi:hypothetical protein